ncbi:hypothetical protein Egran_01555 [Elaphomyces granulatus]|uniref:3-oxo-5-alpha-steroid 4-dehydrogenase C-terminal domain-containing protein n=1 Tax=Elaphomyces granulatus TaxID=519963 RepID=A0A232M2W6_9EURO|nr:hypothetical protein Egran_01555 [Elaphomyces granulatus]
MASVVVPRAIDFFPPTPQAYNFLLNVFQYFPVVTIALWLLSFYPAGKTSFARSHLNFPGRIAWFAMEIVGSINLLFILFTLPQKVDVPTTTELPGWNKLTAALYIIHYINRAIISPFTAPSVSPVHASVAACAALFNWLNTVCIGGWLVGYETAVVGWKVDGARSDAHHLLPQRLLPCLGVVTFFLGMAGNIQAERELHRLRRAEADRRVREKEQTTGQATDPRNRYSKVYVIPPEKGLFRSILFPHYTFEWIEWFGFVLVGTAIFPSPSPSISSSFATPPIKLVPWLVPAAMLAEKLQIPLPLPALIFLVNTITNMLPRARWGRSWYVNKFGEKAVAGRGAVIPWVTWL